jgi:hypothetical protein
MSAKAAALSASVMPKEGSQHGGAAMTATDTLNLALQDAPRIGAEFGYGDLAAFLVDRLERDGYAITREALCARSGGCHD